METTTPDAPRTWTTPAVLALALLGAILARLVAATALGDVPHVQDEQAYLLQARTLAAGQLFTDVPLPRAAFTMWFVDDRWARFGIFPPGWPAALALGVKLHLVWWVNPLLHAIATWFVALAARRIGGARAALVAAAIYALGPQAILLGASLMSHALIAACAAVVLYAGGEIVAGASTAGKRALAGAAIGVALTTRPLCAFAIALGLGAMLAYAIRAGRARYRDVVAIAPPIAAAAALLLAYNAALTGSATRFPQTSYFDGHLPPVDKPIFNYHPGCNDLGFGPTHGCDYGIAGSAHDLANALSNTGDNLWAWLLLAGGGPLVFLAMAYGLRANGWSRATLLVPIVAVVFLYALYWYAGTSYGARFYHAALPALIVLAALGVSSLRGRAVLAGVMTAWLAWNGFALAKSRDELTGTYWATDARFGKLASSWRDDDALVMLAFAREPARIRPLAWTTRLVKEGTWFDSQRAGGALAQNSAGLDGRVVFAKFHPALVSELRARFPHRDVWLYVAHERAEDDRLVRYDAVAHEIADAPPPADNFDGYAVDDEPWPRHAP